MTRLNFKSLMVVLVMLCSLSYVGFAFGDEITDAIAELFLGPDSGKESAGFDRPGFLCTLHLNLGVFLGKNSK